MSALSGLIMAFAVGTAIGALYLLLLWYSLKRIGDQRRPLLFFIAGALVRIALVLLGMYAVLMLGDWRHAVAALAGFTVVRWLVGPRMTPKPTPPTEGGR